MFNVQYTKGLKFVISVANSFERFESSFNIVLRNLRTAGALMYILLKGRKSKGNIFSVCERTS